MQFYFPENDSVLQAKMMVEWKRSRSVYNFKCLPETAIVCVDYSAVKHLDSFGAKKIKGIKGHNFIKGRLLFCSGFDNGGPGILNLLEELRALGVKRFVFIGLSGRLTHELKESSIYAVEKAISGIGASVYYYEGNEIVPYAPEFFMQLKDGLQLESCICFSTDAPFRETKPLLEQAIQSGAQLIEMECAAIYAFAQFYKIEAVCFLIAADDLTNSWLPPGNWNHLLQQQRSVLDRLIKVMT